MSSSSSVTQSKKTGLGWLTMKMNALQSFEMLQISHPMTQHHIQKALFLHISEVLKVLHNVSKYLYPIKTTTNLRIPVFYDVTPG
jgi:hypothetical protein